MGTERHATVAPLDRSAGVCFRLCGRHLVQSDVFSANAGRKLRRFPTEVEREYALKRVVLAWLVEDDHRLIVLG